MPSQPAADGLSVPSTAQHCCRTAVEAEGQQRDDESTRAGQQRHEMLSRSAAPRAEEEDALSPWLMMAGLTQCNYMTSFGGILVQRFGKSVKGGVARLQCNQVATV